MNISGKTKILGIFGYPIEHSLSPIMHNAVLKHLDLDYCYIPLLVHPDMLNQAVQGIKALNIKGVNITIPHKEAVIPLLDEISDEANCIGSVNTIKNIEGKLIGFNTDGKGFMKSLSEADINVEDKKVLIIGAGGAARAVGYYLSQEANQLYIYNRNMQRSVVLQGHLNSFKNNVAIIEHELMNSHDFFSDLDIIINTTPLGLKDDDMLPLDVDLLRGHQVICDLIYKETPLLQKASSKGCKTINGLGMLLWQGVLAFEIWTEIQPPVEIMKEALLKQFNTQKKS